MKRLTVIVGIAGVLIAAAVCDSTQAARGFRPARRNCVGVTHQPSAPVNILAPKTDSAVTDYVDCVCAFYAYINWGSYYSWYAWDYTPDCDHGHSCSIDGNFYQAGGTLCPDCPGSQCVDMGHASLRPDNGGYFKPGTKLAKKLQWDSKVIVNSGTAKLKGCNGLERTVEIETKELTDARMLVSFTVGNTHCYAKLHVCRVEATETAGNKATTVTDFAAGQEIEPPPNGHKVIDVTAQTTVKDPNVAHIKIGTTTYQVVTLTPLSE